MVKMMINQHDGLPQTLFRGAFSFAPEGGPL